MSQITEARVRTEGGRLSTHDMQQLVQCALDAGLHSARLDHRQTWLLENEHRLPATSEQINKLNASLAKSRLCLAQDIERNIVSSVPSFRVFGDTDWMDAGVYSVLLRELSAISTDALHGQTLSLIDPKQNLIPLLHSNINCIASNRVDYWTIIVCTNELQDVPMTYPRLIGSGSLASFVQNLAQHLTGDTFNWATLCNQLTNQNQWQQTEPESTEQFAQPAVPHYDGIHRYADGYWLGIARASRSFELTALAQLVRMASAQGIEYLHMSTWGALIIKKIQAEHLPQWNWFLSLNRWDEGMSYAHLNWIIPHAPVTLIELHKRIVSRLHEMGLRTWGLSFGLQDEPSEVTPIDIRPSILIIRARAKFRWLGVRYRIYVATKFNPLLGKYQLLHEHLTEHQLIDAVQQTVMQYQRLLGLERSSAPIAPTIKIKVSNIHETTKTQAKQPIPHCGVCGWEYHAVFGEPKQHILPNTMFSALPDDFTCSVCEANKNAFVLG